MTLRGVILPMSRREECPDCAADQHVCKMCEFYDSKSRGTCHEERAESVSDTERANFCDYFKPSNCAFNAAASKKSEDAKARFAALFGDEPDSRTSSVEDDEKPLSPAQIAEQKLRDLLGE